MAVRRTCILVAVVLCGALPVRAQQHEDLLDLVLEGSRHNLSLIQAGRAEVRQLSRLRHPEAGWVDSEVTGKFTFKGELASWEGDNERLRFDGEATMHMDPRPGANLYIESADYFARVAPSYGCDPRKYLLLTPYERELFTQSPKWSVTETRYEEGDVFLLEVESRGTRRRFWVDPSKGYNCVRFELWYVNDGSRQSLKDESQPTIVKEVQLEEVGPGVWLPRHVKEVTYTLGSAPGDPVEVLAEREWEMLKCELKSPSEVPDELFALESLNPPIGTEVWDLRLGTLRYLYGQPPLNEGLVDEALKLPVVTEALASGPSQNDVTASAAGEGSAGTAALPTTSQPERQETSTRAWIVGVACAAVAVLVLAGLGLRSHLKRSGH